MLDDGHIVILAGFQGITPEGHITTLGRGVAVDKNQAKVTVAGVPNQPCIAARVFKSVADAHINIDVIVQNVSERGHTDISFTLAANESARRLGVAFV